MDFKQRVEAIMAPKLAALEDLYLDDGSRTGDAPSLEPVLQAIKELGDQMKECCQSMRDNIDKTQALQGQKKEEKKERPLGKKKDNFFEYLKDAADNFLVEYFFDSVVPDWKKEESPELVQQTHDILYEFIDYATDWLLDQVLPDWLEPGLERLPAPVDAGDASLGRVGGVYLAGMTKVVQAIPKDDKFMALLMSCCADMQNAMSSLTNAVAGINTKIDDATGSITQAASQISGMSDAVQEMSGTCHEIPDLFRRFSS
jgi:uncharacterized protein YoxC